MLTTKKNYYMFYYHLLISKKFNTQKINRILFIGIKNNVLKNKIFKSVQLQNLFNFQSKLTINNIDTIIQQLKFSGFFKHVKIQTSIYKRNQLIIQLCVNPIIKIIQINNINQLKFSAIDFEKICQSQIGYPKNLKLLNNIIENIHKWYFIKGYRWSRINYNIFNNNKLIINIKEGLISKIQISCINKNNLEKFYQQNLNLLIIQELQISPGQILHYDTIESGIIKLKNQHIISSCYYKVYFQNDGTFKIILKYRLPYKTSIYSFYQIIYFPCYLIKLLHIQYSTYVVKIKKWLPEYQINYLCYNLQVINLISHVLFLNKLWLTMKFYYLFTPIKQFNNNFTFNFFSISNNYIYSFFFTSSKKFLHNNYIFFRYLYFKRYNNQFLKYTFAISIKRKFIQTKENLFIFLSNYHNTIKFHLNNAVLEIIELTIINDLFKLCSINQQFNLIQEIYQLHLLYIHNIWTKYYKNIYESVKNLMAFNLWINYYFDIVSNVYNYKHNNQLNIFWTLSTKIISLAKINSEKLNLPQIAKCSVSLKYKQITKSLEYKLSKIFYKLLIDINLEINNENTLFQYYYNNTAQPLSFFHTIQNSKYTLIQKINYLFTYNLELYLYRIQKFNFFIFITSEYYISCQKLIYNNYVGMGITTYSQIKTFPIIKFKFEIHNINTYKIYVTFSFK